MKKIINWLRIKSAPRYNAEKYTIELLKILETDWIVNSKKKI